MEKIVKKLTTKEGSERPRWRDAYVRECLWCKKEFLATITEINKGDGRFCSRSCGAHHNNNLRQRKPQKLKCQICNKAFHSVAPQAKFCSNSCRRHQKAKLSKEYQSNPQNHVYHLSAKVQKKYGKLPCLIKNCGCGWTKEFLEINNTTCDLHHIVPRREGGDDSYSNIAPTCPNSHRLCDKGIISRDKMVSLADYIASLE